MLYWWWFVGLSFLFGVGVATTVLPLPAGWVVRKQLARALRQEGAVLAATLQLLTAGGPAVAGSQPGPDAEEGAAAAEPALGGEHCGGDGGEGSPCKAAHTEGRTASLGGLASSLGRLWCRSRRSRLRHVPSLGAGLSRISLAVRRGSRDDLTATAAALGVHPELYPAVEPIYTLSGPASASIQASREGARAPCLAVSARWVGGLPGVHQNLMSGP